MKKTSTKNNERFWLWELLWIDEKNITDAVAEYNTTPWYSTYRFGLLCFVIITLILSAVLLHEWAGFLLFAILMVPMGYFVMRGYRFSYVLLGLLRLLDFVLMFPKMAMAHRTGSIIMSLIFASIWIGLCITCYRIETARHKKYKDAGKVTKTDKVLMWVCGIFVLLFAGLTVYGLSDPKYKLEQKYGERNVEIAEDLYIHSVVVPGMCDAFLPKMAELYNESHSEKLSGEDFKNIYLYRYWSLNKDILNGLPESLIADFRDVAGEETTKTMTEEFIKIGQRVMDTKEINDSVYMTVCSMLFTVDDEHMKINIK